MKHKNMFNLNIIQDDNSTVYFILPDIIDNTFETLNLCVQFMKKYHKIILLCNQFELSFYKVLINTSHSFTEIKNDIAIEPLHSNKLKEILAKECLIIYLKNDTPKIDHLKHSIFCSTTGKSDIVFNDLNAQSKFSKADYLRCLMKFFHIHETKALKDIDLHKDDVIKASPIVSRFIDKPYYVIFLDSIFASFKVSSHLKKNRLTKHLIVISKNHLMIADNYLTTFKEYTFLDLLALELTAKTVSYSKTNYCRDIINNMRISLSLFTIFKDYPLILEDITESKKND